MTLIFKCFTSNHIFFLVKIQDSFYEITQLFSDKLELLTVYTDFRNYTFFHYALLQSEMKTYLIWISQPCRSSKQASL